MKKFLFKTKLYIIPKRIRKFFKFYAKKDCQAIIKKLHPADIAYLQALESTLSEWHSHKDDEDYCD